jgi:predicted alpha/beta-fold hydrolase
MTEASVLSAPPTVWTPRAEFIPRRWLGNGHVMTVYAWACRREFASLGEPESRLIQVEDHTRVLAHAHWQPERHTRPTLVALHGLEGSSSVHYVRGLADKAWRLGWNIVRLNQRNCGGTEHLTPSLYHSGLTSDPLAVMRSLAATEGLRDFGVVGYSLGGNLTMKLAAEAADAPDVPVRAVVAVCPTIDLERCVAAIERRSNVIYQFNFVRSLKARMRRKAAFWPGAFDLSQLDRIRTIRQFDDAYTAPHHGFGNAANYYRQASALRVADRVRVPALMLASSDDPCVPVDQFNDERIRSNPNIHVAVTAHGGHCGFVSANGDPGGDSFWAESEAIRFLSSFMPA